MEEFFLIDSLQLLLLFCNNKQKLKNVYYRNCNFAHTIRMIKLALMAIHFNDAYNSPGYFTLIYFA